MRLTDWFQAEFLLICIAVEAEITSIWKVPKSLKGRISNTLCGNHTKFSSDLPEEVLNTSKVLLWFCILSFCNHGNQYDLKWPLPLRSPKYSNVLNNQITATMFWIKGHKIYYVPWHMLTVLRHPILHNLLIVSIAYLIKRRNIISLVG